MYLVVGQIGVARSDSEVFRLCRAINKNGLIDLEGCEAWKEQLEPFSWAIGFDFPCETFEEVNVERSRADDVLLIVKCIGEFFGRGIYYFRGIDRPLESFWDSSVHSMAESTDLFGGIPLSITIGENNLNVIRIYRDWMNEFVKTNFSGYIKPFTSTLAWIDPLRAFHYALFRLLALKGNWVFKLSYRNESVDKKSVEAKTKPFFSFFMR